MRAILILAVAFALCAAAKADPVSVTKSDVQFPGIAWELRVTARADKVTIKNVVVNRGCKTQQVEQLPQTLRFGNAYSRYYLCDPIEVQVYTDQGDSSFTWGEVTSDPVSVMTSSYLNPGFMWQLVVTNRSDSLTIKNIVVNRGNCVAQNAQLLPVGPMKFGQKFQLILMCKPIEAQVLTDQGSPTFSFRE